MVHGEDVEGIGFSRVWENSSVRRYAWHGREALETRLIFGRATHTFCTWQLKRDHRNWMKFNGEFGMFP